MARSKAHLFRSDETKLADLAKAISHPARIAVLKRLSKQTECICGEIVEVMPLAQATVSQHLKELKRAGFISGTVDGPKSCYCLNAESIEEFADMLNDLVAALKNNQKCC